MTTKLIRPICFIDLETTGVDTQKSRIVEIAVLKLDVDAVTRIVKTRRVNPEEPIPAGATAVHGITDADVAGQPTFAQIAKGLHGLIANCDIAGFNSNSFDVPLLLAEFNRAGVELDLSGVNLIDIGNIFKIQNPRTLSAAYLHYLGKPLDNAHSAEADIIATHDILKQMFIQHSEVPRDMSELDLYSNYGNIRLDISGKFSVNAYMETVYNFGKNYGKPVTSDLDYLNWMITQGEFAPDTKQQACKIWEDHFAAQAEKSGAIGKEVLGVVKDIFKK